MATSDSCLTPDSVSLYIILLLNLFLNLILIGKNHFESLASKSKFLEYGQSALGWAFESVFLVHFLGVQSLTVSADDEYEYEATLSNLDLNTSD